MLPRHVLATVRARLDTYPAVALQEADGYRSDVAVINYSLLNTRWYQEHIQDRYGIKLPFSAKELDNLKPVKIEGEGVKTVASRIMAAIIKAKSENKFDRPIAISITVADSGFAEGYENHFVLKGPFKLWTDEPYENKYDIQAIEASLEGLNLDDFTGPFVSEADRSPVRRVTAKKVANNFVRLAITCANQESEMGRTDRAGEMLSWAERADNLVIKDPEIKIP